MWAFTFRKPPPEPKVPRWIVQLITPLILTIFVGMTAFITNGFTEDLKGKANNETVLLYMKKQQETDNRQWEAIQKSFEKQDKDKREESDKIDKKFENLQQQIIRQQELILEILKESKTTPTK